MSKSTPSKEDAAREATAMRVQKVKPEPAPEHMTEAEYTKWAETKRIFTNREVMLSAEEALRIVMCRMCLTENGKFGMIKGAQLVVRYEDDPLRAVGSLALTQCHHCGFEMHVNIPSKVLSAEQKRKREMEEQMAALGRQKYAPNWGGNIGQNMGMYDHRGSAMAYSQREMMEQDRIRHERNELMRQLQNAVVPPLHVQKDMDEMIKKIIK